MYARILRLIALATVLMASISICIDAAIGGQGTRPSFSIIFVSEIWSDSQRAQLLATATQSRIEAVQQALALDRNLSAELRAKGIQLRNIIRRDRAFDGGYVIYVR